jgi:hypothetical protein
MVVSAPQIENEMLSLGVYALVVRGQGQDLLMGKHVIHSLSLPGLEKLLQYFIAELDKDFKFIYKNDVKGFLNELQAKFHLDFISLLPNLESNIKNMQDFARDDIMVWYLVITKTLEFMREEVYNHRGSKQIAEIYEKKNKKGIPKEILSHIQDLDEIGDEDLSLLYSLVFVQFLSETFNQPLITKEIDTLIDQKIAHLFSVIKS